MSRRKIEPETPMAKRIKAIRDHFGDDQAVFAKKLGVATSTYAGWERGKNEPPASIVPLFHDKMNINIIWLVNGNGGMFYSPSMASQIDSRHINQPENDNIALPIYNIHASAGFGAVVPEYEGTENSVLFSKRFLRSLGAKPDACVIIHAKGDSMMPTISDGTQMVIDTSQQQIMTGNISVVNVAGDLLVKRIRRRLNGDIELVSDNKDYPIETIEQGNTNQVNVVGKVVYFCRIP